MSTLIFGATGFIGTWLRRELQSAGHEIVAVAREALDRPAEPRTIWLQIDLAQPRVRLPDLPDVDRIIYLAQSHRYRDFPAGALDVFQVNVAALLAALDWARAHGVRTFIYASSANVYAPSRQLLREGAPLEPSTFYGRTKLAAEVLAAGYADYFRTIALRLFSPYGPGQIDMLIPALIHRVRTGTPIEVKGDVGLVLSPLYVTDAVGCVRRLLEQEAARGFEALNVGGPEPLSIRAMGVMIGEALGITPSFRIVDGPEPDGFAADNSGLHERIGWSPTIRFLAGVRQMILSQETGDTTTRN